MKHCFLSIFILFSLIGHTQERDTIKVMSYNLLNFPSMSPNRIDTLKNILAYIQPDIFMVCELTSGAGADDILFNALNEDGISHYDMADFVLGPADTENELYFNTNKLGLIEQNVIPTVLRDINEYVLYYKSTDIATILDTTFFYVYVCHLKASSGFESQRNEEVQALKTYLADRPTAENIIVGGDFNFYGSDTEPAWNTLLNSEDIVLKDPLILPGHWHTDDGFAWVHTQSTRTTTFDGGSYGGMDDRFDFIFIGQDLKNYSNDAKYINTTYRAVGQDGFHYNKALIDAPTNMSEPSDIISNLYYMSDHLPVYLEIEVIKEGASISEIEKTNFSAYYNIENDNLIISSTDTEMNLSKTNIYLIYSLNGQLIDSKDSLTDNTISTQLLTSGTYILKIKDHDFSFKFTKP